MTLKTRPPTGRAGYPKILVEGTDKSGKSWSLAQLSTSPKVGRVVVLVLGEDESRWDEYGLIPGARFELAVHDGTWPSIMAAVKGAKAEAAKAHEAGEPPFVFGFDNVTAEWDGHKDWATWRCRHSRKNREILAKDPNAEIDVTSNYWNDARARHRALMREVLLFPGIVVLIARGGEVTAFQNNKPVAGKKDWSVEGEKNLAFDVSTHVRLSRSGKPLLISASGVHCQIRPGIDPPRPLPDDWSLESVIFGMLKLDPGTVKVGGFVEMKTADRTPEEIRDEALETTTTPGRLVELRDEARAAGYQEVTLDNESGDEELLLTMLGRFYRERGGRPLNGAAQRNGTATAAPSNGHGPSGGNGNGSRPQRQQRPAAQAHSTPDATTAKGAQRDVASEETFVRDFYERLSAVTDPAGLTPFRREVAQAEANGVLSRENVTVLNQSVNKRARELATAGATA